MRQLTLDGIKPRLTNALRHTDDCRLQHAAHAVAVFCCRKNSSFHLLFGGGIQHGKGLFMKQLNVCCQIVKRPILYACAAPHMRADQDAFSFKRTFADRSGSYKRCCDPAAEMTAASAVLIAVVLALRCVIRMGWTGRRTHLRIIAALHVLIGNQDGDGRSRRFATAHAADDLKSIFFLSGCGNSAAWAAQIQHMRDICFIHRNARRQPINHRADHFPVTFTKEGHSHAIADCILHTLILQNRLSPCR